MVMKFPEIGQYRAWICLIGCLLGNGACGSAVGLWESRLPGFPGCSQLFSIVPNAFPVVSMVYGCPVYGVPRCMGWVEVILAPATSQCLVSEFGRGVAGV